PDGRVVVAGNFLRVNGTPRASIARIQPDGTLDYCFDVPFAAGAIPLALDVAADGVVTIGGSFGGFGGQWRPHLARLIPPAGCDPGVVEFAAPAVNAGEDAPRAVVPVIRRGGSDREQTVEFATRDGSALAGEDYDGAKGTLHFAPGERSQFLSVPLHRDSMAEDGETFEVVLSAPGGGAVLGAQTNAVVTINTAA